MRYIVYNDYECYGSPAAVLCYRDEVDGARHQIAISIAECCWPAAVDGMVDMSGLLREREERGEPEAGFAREIDHCNEVLDAAQENGGTLPLDDLIAMIAADAVVVEEFTGEN
jgi:hypothetical protein